MATSVTVKSLVVESFLLSICHSLAVYYFPFMRGRYVNRFVHLIPSTQNPAWHEQMFYKSPLVEWPPVISVEWVSIPGVQVRPVLGDSVGSAQVQALAFTSLTVVDGTDFRNGDFATGPAVNSSRG